MRITQVLEATGGGTRRHLCETVAALSTPEVRLHLVVAIGREPSFHADIERFRGAGHEVTVLPMTPGVTPGRDLRAILDLRRLLRDRPPEVLHLHSAKAGWIGRLAARGLGLTVAYSPHAFPFLRRDPGPWPWLYHRIERSLAAATDRLVAVSGAEGRLAVESGLYPPERVCLLPNAVDAEAVQARLPSADSLGPAATDRTFGLIGALRPQKDPLTLVEAARRLHQRGVPARFLLPRHGVLVAAVKERIRRYQLEERFEWVDVDDSLDEVFRRSQFVVLPSRWEGLPYSLLDALALRRPVITSDLPVFEDLLTSIDPRAPFPAGNADALADRVERWVRAPVAEIEEVAERGRAKVLRDHDPLRWKQDLLSLYRALATSSAGGKSPCTS